jgi:hypothetical protein
MHQSFDELFHTSRPVTAFDVAGGALFFLAGKSAFRFDIMAGQIVRERVLFEREGQARGLLADGTHLYVRDFCDLHVLERDSLAPLRRLVLGADLSSDICAMGADDASLYLTLRNGPLVRIRKDGNFAPEIFPAAGSSIWDFTLYGGRIYAGSVAGDLLVIDAASLALERAVSLSRQNVKSLLAVGDRLVVAAQDKKLTVLDLQTLAPLAAVRGAHDKAFAIAGAHAGRVYTICHASGEVKAWDAQTWALRETFRCPARPGPFGVHAGRLYVGLKDEGGLFYRELG